jgi:hypothetical protein
MIQENHKILSHDGILFKIQIERLLAASQKLLEDACSVERCHEGPQLHGLYGTEWD